MNDLLQALGVPRDRTAATIARAMHIDPARLSPSRLARDSDLLDALRVAVAVFRGEQVPEVSLYAKARAGALVEALDGGAPYSLPQLGARMRLWGMDTADDWLVRLHEAGARAVFAERGWCGVRMWAREVCR